MDVKQLLLTRVDNEQTTYQSWHNTPWACTQWLHDLHPVHISIEIRKLKLCFLFLSSKIL